jgi:hypothetical protein
MSNCEASSIEEVSSSDRVEVGNIGFHAAEELFSFILGYPGHLEAGSADLYDVTVVISKAVIGGGSDTMESF